MLSMDPLSVYGRHSGILDFLPTLPLEYCLRSVYGLHGRAFSGDVILLTVLPCIHSQHDASISPGSNNRIRRCLGGSTLTCRRNRKPWLSRGTVSARTRRRIFYFSAEIRHSPGASAPLYLVSAVVASSLSDTAHPKHDRLFRNSVSISLRWLACRPIDVSRPVASFPPPQPAQDSSGTGTWITGNSSVPTHTVTASPSATLIETSEPMQQRCGYADGNRNGTETRLNGSGGPQSPQPDTRAYIDISTATQGKPGGLTMQTEMEEEEGALVLGDAAPRPRLDSRARRVTLLLLEGDGGIRLLGRLPDVAVEVEPVAEREQSLSNSDSLVNVDITRLPPPYHRYNS